MKLNQLFIFCFVFTTLILQSCQDKENTSPQEDPGSSNDALNLTYSLDYKTITLHWESLNLSNFEKYLIVRSLDSIPDSSEPPESDQRTLVRAQNDQDLTTFTDIGLPLALNWHFKVFVETEDRFIPSKTIKIPTEFKPIGFHHFHAALIPETNHVIVTSRDNDIIKYDYLENEKLVETTTILDSVTVRIGDAGNGLEIFAFNPSQKFLYILDVNDLSVKEEVYLETRAYDLAPSDKGIIFLTTKDDSQSLISIKRSDFSIVDHKNEQNANRNRRVVLSPVSPSELYEISGLDVSIHNFDDNGFFTADTTFSIDINDSALKKDVAFSTNGDRFSFHKKAAYFDTQNISKLADHPYHSVVHTFDKEDDNIVYFSDYNNIFSLELSTGKTKLLQEDTGQAFQIFDLGEGELLILSRLFSYNTDTNYIAKIRK